jgi:uracil-DNA glycosylase
VRLYPLYHPAAALYTPSTLEALRADFHRIPELLALGPLEQPEALPPLPDFEEQEQEDDDEPVLEPARAPEAREEPAQLGLF